MPEISDPQNVIDKIKQVAIQKPADSIIKQIRDLITSGDLNPGDRLPAERTFAEKFGVGRAHVREAIKKLEVYGILKTLPQSGTFVAAVGSKPLEDLIAGVIDPEKDDIDALLETRLILEVNAARLAARHASRDDLIELIRIHETFRRQIKTGDAGLAEDHQFHLKVAALSKNPVLCSLITFMVRHTHDYPQENVHDPDKINPITLWEHESILQAIKQKDPNRAAISMEEHMKTVIRRIRDDSIE